MPTKPLSPKQKRLWSFIKSFREKKGFAPTLEEMRVEMGVAARSVIHAMLTTMERNGWIERKTSGRNVKEKT